MKREDDWKRKRNDNFSRLIFISKRSRRNSWMSKPS